MPAGLAGDRLEQERVDLGERVVAGKPAERVRELGVEPGVVQRVPGLVQEGLVVVEAALGPRDQVDDRRRVGGDHARARALLRPVVEVEPDALVRGQVEPDARRASPGRPARSAPSGRGRRRATSGAGRRRGTEAGSASRSAPRTRSSHSSRIGPQSRPARARPPAAQSERAWRSMFFRAALRATGSGLARELGVERLALLHQRVAGAVEARGGVGGELAQLVARRVVVQHRELRLRRAERQRLAAELDPLGEDGVLELVGLVGELADDDAAGRGLAQPVEALALLAPGARPRPRGARRAARA